MGKYDFGDPYGLLEGDDPLKRSLTGVIDIVYDDPNDVNYGKIKVKWRDIAGNPPVIIDIMGTCTSWQYASGVFSLPNKNDIVVCEFRPGGIPLVHGFLSFQLNKMVNLKRSKAQTFGAIRAYKSGELILKSNKQAEIYLDDNGNIKGFVRDQAQTETVTYTQDGKTLSFNRVKYDTGSASDASSTVLVDFTLGTGDNRVTINTKEGSTITIDSSGNISISSTNGNVIVNAKNVDVTADAIMLGGSDGAVVAQGLPPGTPITDVSQLKVAMKVKAG